MKHRRRSVVMRTPIPDRVGIEKRFRRRTARALAILRWTRKSAGRVGKGAILIITERSTNYSMVEKLPKGKNAEALAKVVVRLLTPYIDHIHTITTDNGSEFAAHKTIAKELHTIVYFSHIYTPHGRKRR